MSKTARVLTVGATLVASALVAGAATASATSGTSDEDGDGPRGHEVTLRFDVETSPFTYTDLGQPGPSAADVIVFHDRLFADGREVGHEVGSCVVVEPSGLSNCTAVVTLDGQGTITYAFENAPPPEKALAVTGGSGMYRTARGDGSFVESGQGTGVLTLSLVLR
ncbi:allene oxide cyclase barrel-like domain-containing protein [Blastococcus mobilis]|uniref:Allene oxide cyclase barrel-like domain-containing protein n=1 Tax=Blastococcus mobilis TaxID=1938746 RepID=A0A238XYP4_9ACTN|nr:hypothetical protein [Blastococcus mobilis]SNR63830.1 hypothetical protein SAMN06272737_11699 [Blastococcus mobilis]